MNISEGILKIFLCYFINLTFWFSVILILFLYNIGKSLCCGLGIHEKKQVYESAH